MKGVWKYTLSVIDRQSVGLPKGATILSVGNQHGSLVMWALVDFPDSIGHESRIIRVVGTGHMRDDLNSLKFIGTVQFENGQLIFHVFEEAEARQA